MKATTHLAVADGADDAQLGLAALHEKGYWPNLLARHWDQAHGARRVTQRPWAADPACQEVVDTLITSPASVNVVFGTNVSSEDVQSNPELFLYLREHIQGAAPKFCFLHSRGDFCQLQTSNSDSTCPDLHFEVLRGHID